MIQKKEKEKQTSSSVELEEEEELDGNLRFGFLSGSMETKKLIILTKPSSSLEMLLTLCFYFIFNLCILLKWNLYFIFTKKREHQNKHKRKQNKTRKMGFQTLSSKFNGGLENLSFGPNFRSSSAAFVATLLV